MVPQDVAVVRPTPGRRTPPDPRHLRNTMGQFATGVTVVTYAEGEQRYGATVNSFTSVSLTPPLVLVSMAQHSRAARSLSQVPFVVNILAEDQRELALHFAGVQGELSAENIPWSPSHDVPRLRGCVAWVECVPFASHQAGDHVLFLGEVVSYHRVARAPLLFSSGRFHTVGLELPETRVQPPAIREGEWWAEHLAADGVGVSPRVRPRQRPA